MPADRAQDTTLNFTSDDDDPEVNRFTADVLVAKALLGRIVARDDPHFHQDGLAIAVTITTDDWAEPAAEAWRLLVAEARDIRYDDTVHGLVERVESRLDLGSMQQYFVLLRPSGKGNRPNKENTNVLNVLTGGRTVVGFAVAERLLPSNLLRAIDFRVVMPPPDWAAVYEAVSILTGSKPAETLPDSFCGALAPNDLILAERPGQNADDYVRRLKRLMVSPTSTSRQDALCLDELHGFGEAAKWGLELAEDLAAYRKGRLSWSDVSRGALLAGPPGVGKTTFARSLARTCERETGVEVPLVACSYAQWQSAGHLGDFLKAMLRDFHLASSSTPSIIFVDEIDSFSDRERLSGDNADYGRQCVNALLEQIDGVGSKEGVVCIGATNSPSKVDPALVRPGRLDRVIVILPPSAAALKGIFQQYLGREHALTDVDLNRVVRGARGATGAHVAGWCRDGRRRARKAGRVIEVGDILAAIYQDDVGPRNPSSLRLAAVHEAGHAYLVVTERPGTLEMVHVRSRGDTGGQTSVDQPKEALTLHDIMCLMRQGLAGRAAEAVMFGEVSNAAGGPAGSDLARVTALAVSAVVSYGLDDGAVPIWLGAPSPDTVQQILLMRPDIRERVEQMIAQADADATAVIRAGRRTVAAIAAVLRRRGVLVADEVEAIVARHQRSVGK